MLISRTDCQLLIVDIQEKLAPAIHDAAAAVANNSRLLAAAAQLKVPVVVTEQYVRGLGPTVAELQPWLQAATVDVEKIEKIHFGACGEPGFVAGLQADCPLANRKAVGQPCQQCCIGFAINRGGSKADFQAVAMFIGDFRFSGTGLYVQR